MTILDHGVSSKSKEDGAQSRQTNLENSNRKQRSRSGHCVRDRVTGHSRSGQVNSAVGVDYTYWTDPAVSHRSADPHFEQETPSHLQLQHEDLNVRGHIKPRGLSKSSAAPVTKSENQTLVTEAGPVEGTHSLSVSTPVCPTSDVPSSSYSAKSIARLIKKGSEKKISHKKKHRRGFPHQHPGKVVKCSVKTKAQVHRAKVTHLKPAECMLTSAETSSSVTHTYVSPALLNTGNAEASNRYCNFQGKPSEFLGSTLTSDQYQTRSLLPSASRKSPNVVDGERRITEVNKFEKDVANEESEAKNNSDDEYDQTRIKRLHCGVDFTKLEQEFEEKLKKSRGFVIKAMEEDGACLFRAVADQVYGDQEMHDEVRKNCMNYMTKNSDYYSNYVTEDFDMYIARKRELHTHGNHLEIQAMAELYNRPFEVYQYSTEPINTFQTSHASANPPVRVSYHRNTHYNSVIDPYAATIGVGLGLPSFNPGLVDDNMVKAAVKASCEVWEQQMLNDKVQATDWESTDDAILEQVARESYMEYIEEKTNEIQEVKPEVHDVKKSPERNISNEQCSTRASPSKIVKEFPKKINRASSSAPSDWVAEEDEWQVLSQVLANSQQEYMDALKHQATHSKATCSKYM